jgi:WD40 repeat protein
MFRHACAAVLLLAIAHVALAEPPADKLPPGAIARLGSYRFYHGGFIKRVAISPDGKFIATAGSDGTSPKNKVCLWDAASGEQRWSASFDGDLTYLSTALFSPDGKMLAIGENKSILLFDAASGQPMRTIEAGSFVHDLIFSSDSRQLIEVRSHYDGGVKWFDVRTGKMIRERTPWPNGKPGNAPPGKQEHLGEIAFSSDQTIIACAMHYVVDEKDRDREWDQAPGPIIFIDAESGKVLHKVSFERKYRSLIFSPKGHTLLAAGLDGAWLINADDGKMIADFSASLEELEGAAFAPDGKSVLLSDKKGTHLFNSADGKKISSIPKLTHALGLFVSPDGGKVACWRWSNLGAPVSNIGVADIRTGEMLWDRDFMFPIDSGPDIVPRFLPDGKTMAIIADEAWVNLFDTATGKERLPERGLQSPVANLAFQDKGQQINVSTANGLVMWNAATNKVERRAAVNWFSVEKQIENGEIKVEGHVRDDATCLLVRDKSDAVFILDLQTGKKLPTALTLPKPPKEIVNFQLSAGGKYVALTIWPIDDECIEILEVASSRLVRRITGFASHDSMQFSPDGTQFAYVDEKQSLVVIEVSTGALVSRIPNVVPGHDNVPKTLLFSPDQRSIVVPPQNSWSGGSELRQVRFYALPSGVETGRIQLAVSDKAFHSRYLRLSADGRLATGTIDGENEVLIWETASSQYYYRFAGHRSQPTAVALSPNGRTLASGGYDGAVFVWDLAFPLSEHRAKTKSKGRDLTALWADLAGADVPKAWAAIADLAEAPGALAFLKEKLLPVRVIGWKEIRARVEKLSSASYEEREQATRELAAFGEGAQAQLENELKFEYPPEARRRVQALLDSLHNPNLSGDRLRQWRAVAVLERIGTPDAVKLLGSLAVDLPETRLTIAVKDAVGRLRETEGKPRR